MKRTTLILAVFIALLMTSCAEEKELVLNGKMRTFEPYGWIDHEELKNDSIIYKANTENIVLDIILCETIFVPVWLTGWQFYEPVAVKTEYK